MLAGSHWLHAGPLVASLVHRLPHTPWLTGHRLHHWLHSGHRYDIKEVAAKQEEGQQLQVVINRGSTDEATQPQKLYKLYLVQEHCCACLRTALAKKLLRRMDGRRCVRLTLVLLLDIATGLTVLHERNIAHGDLKPANILLKVGV